MNESVEKSLFQREEECKERMRLAFERLQSGEIDISKYAHEIDDCFKESQLIVTEMNRRSDSRERMFSADLGRALKSSGLLSHFDSGDSAVRLRRMIDRNIGRCKVTVSCADICAVLDDLAFNGKEEGK